MTGENVLAAFKQCGEKGSAQSMADSENLAMPSSLNSAAGAIKIDAATERAATEKQTKKKKKCGCWERFRFKFKAFKAYEVWRLNMRVILS